MDKVSGQNSNIRFCCEIEVLQENFSKPWISQPNLNTGPYTLRLFLVYMSPTWGQNMEPKTVDHLGTFPRTSYIIVNTNGTKNIYKDKPLLGYFLRISLLSLLIVLDMS